MILGIIDHDRGNLNEASLEMLTLARQVAEVADCELEAVLVGNIAEPLAEELGAYGVTAVHLLEDERLNEYAPEAWAKSVVQLIEDEEPEAVAMAGTERGNEIMAHIAAQMNLPMAANCTAVQPGDAYQVTRIRWGGSLLEEAQLVGETKLFTAAPHAIVAEETAVAEDPEINYISSDLDDKDFRVRVTARVSAASDQISLTEARVVIGGGRGVGSAEGFGLLDELAELVGAAVGGSRVATNLGWRPHSDQIGQTGTRIAPDLYIACGISGAIQHMVGCKGAKRILAINTDPESSMVTKADYAVIGDLHEVVPALTAEIKRLKG